MRLFLDLSGAAAGTGPPVARGSRVPVAVDADACRRRSSRPTKPRSRPPTPTRSGPRSSPTSRCRFPPTPCATRTARTARRTRTCSRWPAVDPRLGACHGIDIPVHVRQLRRRLGRVRRRRRTRARRGRASAARRLGERSRAPVNPGWPEAPGDEGVRHARRRCTTIRCARRLRHSRSSGTNSSRSQSSSGRGGRPSTRSTSGEHVAERARATAW